MSKSILTPIPLSFPLFTRAKSLADNYKIRKDNYPELFRPRNFKYITD